MLVNAEGALRIGLAVVEPVPSGAAWPHDGATSALRSETVSECASVGSSGSSDSSGGSGSSGSSGSGSSGGGGGGSKERTGSTSRSGFTYRSFRCSCLREIDRRATATRPQRGLEARG